MEIIVPAIANQYDDWSDRELIVLSLFYYFYTLSYTRDLSYHILSWDIKCILDATNSTSPEAYIAKLRRCLKIGLLSWDVWSVQILYDEEHLSKNGRLTSSTATITDPEAIAIFAYLAGRCTVPDLITEYTGKLPEPDKRNLKQNALMGMHWRHSLLSNEI